MRPLDKSKAEIYNSQRTSAIKEILKDIQSNPHLFMIILMIAIQSPKLSSLCTLPIKTKNYARGLREIYLNG